MLACSARSPRGRGAPRWSVGGQPSFWPPSMAGLYGTTGWWVAVAAPSAASGASCASTPLWSPGPASPHVDPSSRFPPSEPYAGPGPQLAPLAGVAVPPARIVLRNATAVPGEPETFPPLPIGPAAEFAASVTLVSEVVAPLERMAPPCVLSGAGVPLAAELPLSVLLTAVSVPPLRANPPPDVVPGPAAMARLPFTVVRVSETTAPFEFTPPAVAVPGSAEPAVLSAIVLSVASSPPPLRLMAPPLELLGAVVSTAVLPLTTDSTIVTVSGPLAVMAPPAAMVVPSALFPVTPTRRRVRRPARTAIPPPPADGAITRPFVRVRSATVTVGAGLPLIDSTRCAPVPGWSWMGARRPRGEQAV